MEVAKATQEALDAEHLDSVDPDTYTKFPVNSYVCVMYPRNPLTGRRPPTKFKSFWRGPLKVVNFIGNEYTLEDLVTHKTEQRFVKDLKAFEYDPNHTDPAQVAKGDNNDWTVERVVQHKGQDRLKSTYEFEVKWEGVSEEYNLWLPWKQLHDNEAVIHYCNTNNMQWMLPVRHRLPAQANAQQAEIENLG
jgi:hypothetical protein